MENSFLESEVSKVLDGPRRDEYQKICTFNNEDLSIAFIASVIKNDIFPVDFNSQVVSILEKAGSIYQKISRKNS